MTRERRLPGLAAWARVRDYRLSSSKQMPNVEVISTAGSTVADVLGFGFKHVVVATGAEWRRDGTPGPSSSRSLAGEAPNC